MSTNTELTEKEGRSGKIQSAKAKNVPFHVIRIDQSHESVWKSDCKRHHCRQFSIACLGCADFKDIRQILSVFNG